MVETKVFVTADGIEIDLRDVEAIHFSHKHEHLIWGDLNHMVGMYVPPRGSVEAYLELRDTIPYSIALSRKFRITPDEAETIRKKLGWNTLSVASVQR